MHSLFIWKATRHGRSETCHLVRSLADLKDLVDTEVRGQSFYLESRPADALDEVMDYRLRSSPDDMTDDDFQWLTSPDHGEVRGVRI